MMRTRPHCRAITAACLLLTAPFPLHAEEMMNSMMSASESMAPMMSAAPDSEPAAPTPPTSPEVQAKTPKSAVPEIYFDVPETTVPLGSTAVISFRTHSPASEDVSFEAEVHPPDALEIISAPELLKERQIGFARIRTNKPGVAQLRIHNASLSIRSGPPARGRLELSFSGPQDGSVVWGDITIGAELFGSGNAPQKPPRLVLQDGSHIPPSSVLEPVDGPVTRYTYAINARDLNPGIIPLTLDHENATSSERLSIRIPAKKLETVMEGECETYISHERLKEFGEQPPAVAFDPQASKGRYVQVQGRRPAWYVEIDADGKSHYAVMLTVKGELSGGAFPTLSLVDGNGGPTLGTARVLSPSWHRIALGDPFKLKEGKHHLVIEPANDFRAAGQPARIAGIDKFEIVRVPPNETFASQTRALYADGLSNQARLAFRRPIDSLEISGPLKVDALLWARGGFKKGQPQPEVKLYLNGKEHAKAAGTKPSFTLQPHELKPGTNEIHLVSESIPGIRLETPPQRVFAKSKSHPANAPESRSKTIELVPSQENWKHQHGVEFKADDPGRPHFYVMSNNWSEAELPADLAGSAVIEWELKGTHFDGAPEAEIILVHDGRTTSLGKLKADTNWKRMKVTGQFPGGRQHLRIQFTNDKYEPNRGDRNLYVGTARITCARTVDSKPPEAIVLYPKTGHTLAACDALVAELFDPSGIESIDVLVDGEPQNTPVTPEANPALIPILSTGIPAGAHQVALRVRDLHGNKFDTAAVSVLRPQKWPGANHPHARAVRLLNRFAAGPEPRELALVLAKGENHWIDNTLVSRPRSRGDAAAFASALTALPDENDAHYYRRPLHQFLVTDTPARVRFVLWAQNHFSTWRGKTGGALKWMEHVEFDRAGIAPFPELLRTSTHSPAMLVYLDQQRSFAKRLNENYARELMELHTLGVDGGYTQEDVTTLARMLTGWTAIEEAAPTRVANRALHHFRFAPYLNESTSFTLLGRRFEAQTADDRHDRIREFLELLAGHPSTARHVARKIVQHYAANPEPPFLVDALAKEFQRTGGDMAAMLRTLAKHKEFFETPERLSGPLDYGARLLRICGSEDAVALDEMMNRIGRGLFDRDTPDGFPESDSEYADSNFLLQKWNFARRIEDRLARLIPRRLYTDEALATENGQRRFVEFAAARILARPLGPRSMEAALQLVEEPIEDPSKRALQLASFIAQTPEAQLR